MTGRLYSVVSRDGHALNIPFVTSGMTYTNQLVTTGVTAKFDLSGSTGVPRVWALVCTVSGCWRVDVGSAGTVSETTAAVFIEPGEVQVICVPGSSSADTANHQWLLFTGVGATSRMIIWELSS